MNWLDWVIIVILVLSALDGLRRGLIKTLAKTAGILVGLLVAFTYYARVAEYITERWRPEELTAPLVVPLLTHWRPMADLLTLTPDERLVEYLNGIIANNIIACGSFLVLLLIPACIISIAGVILGKQFEHSLFGPINRTGGLLIGVLSGLFYVAAILLLMAPFQQLNLALAESGISLGSAFPPGNAFEGSMLLKYFRPFLDLLVIKAPLIIPPSEILPDSVREILSI